MARNSFANFSATIEAHGRTIWIGQSVDTSTIHDAYREFDTIPILTSVGCAIRRPHAISEKFDERLRSRVGAKNRLMIDSGGFVLMTKKDRTWNVQRVSRLYHKIDADHLVSLDLPPTNSDSHAKRTSKYDATIRNLARLLDQFGEKIVPVIHGTSRDEIEDNCRLVQRLCPSPSVIAIGGLVPVLQKCGTSKGGKPNSPQRRIADAVRCVRAHFPKSRVHVFGVGSLQTVLGVIAVGAQSVDSIGWRQAAGFGSVYIPGRHRRLLTERVRDRPCRPFVNDEDIEILARCGCPECRVVKEGEGKIERLARHYKPRAVHNIWVLYAEVANYLQATRVGAGRAFLSSRLSQGWMELLDSP